MTTYLKLHAGVTIYLKLHADANIYLKLYAAVFIYLRFDAGVTIYLELNVGVARRDLVASASEDATVGVTRFNISAGTDSKGLEAMGTCM